MTAATPERRVVGAIAGATFLFTVAVGAIVSVLPVYMTEVLGATVFVVGLVEGLGSAAEAVTLVVAGNASDRMKRRKPLAVIGYGLYLAIKPVFLMAVQFAPVAAARICDRAAIALFAAPQQAMIGDASARGGRGAAFGLRAAADGLGAMTGPALATMALGALAWGYAGVFWIALIAAALAFAVFTIGVPGGFRARPEAGETPPPVRWRDALALGRRCNAVLVLAAGVWAAHVSEAFALLRAMDLGLEKSAVPLVFMAMAGAQALTAYPAGRLSDRIGRTRLLGLGVLLLLLAHGVLAAADGPAWVFAGAILWGGHGGLSVGLLTALVADTAPARLRGTAFGAYHLIAGLSALAAMAAAGWVWDAWGPNVMFGLWAGLAAAVLIAVAAGRRRGWLPA